MKGTMTFGPIELVVIAEALAAARKHFAAIAGPRADGRVNLIAYDAIGARLLAQIKREIGAKP
jgi:hypothetical protein